MKSLLLILAISALIINQAYKKKAAAEYLGTAGDDDGSPEAINEYSPFAGYTDLASPEGRGLPGMPLRGSAFAGTQKNAIRFSISTIQHW